MDNKRLLFLSAFIGLCIIKIFFLITFSSHYLSVFFKPFITHFLCYFDNPWQHSYQNGLGVEFPYHPLMLYILSLFYAPVYLLGITHELVQNSFLKLPILLADISIFYLLCRMYPSKKKIAVLCYFASPIILYAAYMHSQLDLIPTAMLVCALYFLRNEKALHASFAFGCALATKLHIAACVPLVLVYGLRVFGYKRSLLCAVISLGTYAAISFRYFLSPGFYHLVFMHPKQMALFDAYLLIGSVKICIPIFALSLVYGRFASYPKINNDLMDAFLAITFLLLVTLIPPAPAWYIWMLPFLSILLIKYYNQHASLLSLYIALNVFYLSFFVFFYQHVVQGCYFLGHPLNIIFNHQGLGSICFTLLESFALLLLYQLYKIGVKSNRIYNKNKSLVVGISGDSGAGKSLLMQDLEGIFGAKSTVLEGDGDHRWERGDEHWKTFTHLDPKANYLHRQADNIAALKLGNPVFRVNYNHHSGRFDPARRIASNEIIMLSGLHTFYLPKMRKIVDVKIYIDPDKDLQKHWKIVRDTRERGHSKERILKQIEHRQEDAQHHIDPQKKFADMVISYKPSQPFVIGDQESFPSLHLNITIDSSIRIDPIIIKLTQQNISVTWNYSNDLQTQILALEQEPSVDLIQELAEDNLVNKEELMSPREKLLGGYRGFTQLMVLMVVSEKLKERLQDVQ